MEKSILDIVGDFGAWRGDTYRLASLVAIAQKEADRNTLIAAGFADAAEALNE